LTLLLFDFFFFLSRCLSILSGGAVPTHLFPATDHLPWFFFRAFFFFRLFLDKTAFSFPFSLQRAAPFIFSPLELFYLLFFLFFPGR